MFAANDQYIKRKDMPIQNQPIVSVVIAAKNEAEFVKDAVESILTQDGCKLELIFVDDHSTDETVKIVEGIRKHKHDLVLLHNQKSGKCSAFNYGVKSARGDYVCIFAGDDIMPQNSLRKRLESIQNLGQDSAIVGLSKLICMSDDKTIDGMIIPRAKGKSSLSGVSPLMNRKAVELIFPVPEQLPNEDTWMDLCITFYDQIQSIHTDIICCKWRHHSGNSINHMLSYDEFSTRLGVRLEAYSLFENMNAEKLSDVNRRQIRARVKCETARRARSILGILLSGCPAKHKFRMLASANPFLYSIRSFFYGLFSGW
jgi:glycosyltransferase involved in cell wall biosynthesis